VRPFNELRRILELWEQGNTKVQIAKLTGIPRGTVRDCIQRYGSVARLEALMRGEAVPRDEGDRNQKRRFTIPYKQRALKYNEQELRDAIANSSCYAEVLRKLEIRAAGGNYATLKKRIATLQIDTSHMTGMLWNKDQASPNIIERPLDDILVKDSDYANTNTLRKRLIRQGLLEPRCASCGLTEWLVQPIPLELDHINGDRFDHRLENLRLLCPNCHALTATYRGKNKRR
jgi:5-methylcytosine-specific restriction endonuclease McrA